MRQVIVFPRGQLTQADRDALIDAEIVAVEADDPAAVVTVLPGAPLAGTDDLLMAALHAIVKQGSSYCGGEFVTELHRRCKAREAAPKA
jgi:hypothetical protein